MVKIGNIEIGDFPLLLAPMEDVSDPPFRAVCKAKGADLLYTEFISVEGLIRHAKKSMQKLDIYDYERPVGIQIFGAEIESMLKATDMVEEANPEILDINYGCPVKNVACKGAGAGILLDLPKMQQMTAEIVKRTKLPVTVKTRLGWDEKSIKIVEVAQRMQDAGAQAMTIHARTRHQMYKGEADWAYIDLVKNTPGIHIPIFGNGDVDNPQKALEYKNRYACDGIMIGRGAIGYPWIFDDVKHYFKYKTERPLPSLAERVETCKQHFEFSVKWKGEKLGVLEMRRHYASYFKGIPGFKPYRAKLVTVDSPLDILSILAEVKVVFEHAHVERVKLMSEDSFYN